MRICTECHKEMIDGYCIGDGHAYYCSDECLHKNISDEEYVEMYENGDAYWTTWYEITDQEMINHG